MNKEPVKPILVFFFLFFVLTTFAIFCGPYINKTQKNNDASVQRNFSSKFNETFLGTIIDIKTPKNQPKPDYMQSIIKLKLDYTSTKYYDTRRFSNNHYFCVIDYPEAELLINSCLSPQIGDTLFYEGISDTFIVSINNEWFAGVPEITNLNNYYLRNFFTIPKYSKNELRKRKDKYPKPFDLPNDYYMLIFGRFNQKEELSITHRKISQKEKYKGRAIPKYFEKRNGIYYFFYGKERFSTYKEAVKAWKNAGFDELYIAKFDKYNSFIKILKKRKRK